MTPASAMAAARTPRSRQIVWAALLLALLTAALAAAFLGYEHRELRLAQVAAVELRARMLEEKTRDVIERSDIIVSALAATLASSESLPTTAELNGQLAGSLEGRFFLRSLSVVDGARRVLASSNPANVGAQVPAAWLVAGAVPTQANRLAPVASGRDLNELGQVPLAQARVLALPMLAPVPDRADGLTVVALVNPEHFATQYERLLDDSGLRALLIGLDGGLIVGTSGVQAPAGASMRTLPAFTDFLPRFEHGSSVGPGSDGGPALGAFRVTRRWPLVVLVEQPDSTWPPGFSRVAAWTAVLLLVSWVLLAAGTLAVWRSFRRDERLTRDLVAAHTATQASESRKLAILQSSLDAIVTVDEQGTVIEFNTAAERMFGHAADLALGRPMHELIVPAKYREAHQAGMARYRATRVPKVLNQRIEIEALRADGTVFPVELTIVPVRTEAGEIFTATLRDISERLRTEAALRESRAMLDKAGRIAGVGGWTVDLATQTCHWTDQTAIIHDRPAGYQPASLDEAAGHGAPGTADRLVQAAKQAAASGEGFDIELPLVTAAGRPIWVRAVGQPEYVDGRPVRIVGAFQDITARVQADLELQQARSHELMIGARIQQSLLVDAPDQRLPGLWLSTLSQASQGIDGDFVELIPLGDRGVDIIVGDVMGKGVAAALMAAGTKMQFSRCVADLLVRSDHGGALPTPAEVVAAVHHAMTPNLQTLEAFVTLSYLRLDTRAGTVTWVGCGHEEPLLLRRGGGLQSLHNQHPPLGVLDDAQFQQDVLPLVPGDAVFLCSDGAADAVLPDGSRLGRDRVTTLLTTLLDRLPTPAAVLHALRRDLTATGARITDDLTLALAQVSGDALLASRRELAFGLDDLVHVRGLIEDRCQRAGLEEVEASLFAVACVEAYTNAVRHTRGRPAEAPVELVVRTEADAMVVEIVTLGEPFEPVPPAAEASFDAFPEGGFGLTIMHRAADRVAHEHAAGVNTVRLTRWRTRPQA